MHGTSFLPAAALTLAACLAMPAASGAQTAVTVPSTLAGSWTHDGALDRGRHTVERAFARSVAALPSFLQSYALGRIRDDLEPPHTIDVSLAGPRIRVTLHGPVTKTIDGTLDAHASTSGVQDGTVVTPQVASGWLDLLYEGESSTMHQLFSTEPDGSHLHLDYAIDNERLAGGTVRYRLEYVRSP